MSENQDLIASLEFAKLSYQSQKESIDASRTSVTTLLSTSSLLIAAMGILGILDPNNARAESSNFLIGMSVLGVIFIVFLFLALLVIMTIKFQIPMKPIWKLHSGHIHGKPTRDAYAAQIKLFMNAFDVNVPKVRRISVMAKWAYFCFGAMVINMFVLFIFLS